MRPRRALPAVLAIAAVLAAVELLSGGGGSAERPAPALPDTVLVPPRATLAGLRGRPALVNFWASWCDPCRHEARQLERFARSPGGRGRLVGVDWSDGIAGARAFVRRYGWTFPVLRDPQGTVGEGYGIAGLPTTFVLDSRGRIVQILRGPQTVATLREALRNAS